MSNQFRAGLVTSGTARCSSGWAAHFTPLARSSTPINFKAIGATGGGGGGPGSLTGRGASVIWGDAADGGGATTFG